MVDMALQLVVEVEKEVEETTCFVPLFDIFSLVDDSLLLLVVDDVDDIVGTVLEEVLEDGQEGR